MTRNSDRYRDRMDNVYVQTEGTVRRRTFERESGDVLYDETDNILEGEYYSSRRQFCQDTVGYRDRDNPLSLLRETISPARGHLICAYSTEDFYPDESFYQIHDTNVEWVRANLGHVIYPEDYGNDDIAFVTEAAAATNPSSAAVQGAVFMAELRELPRLLQTTGSTMAKLGANEYLKYQYGWKPFVKDVKKMFAVISRIEKRMNVLKKLTDSGVLRHNYDPPGSSGIKFHNESQDLEFQDYYFSGGRIRCNVSTILKIKRWADIIWVADPPESIAGISSGSNFDIARNAVYGLNIDGPSLWQAMPWSWLIDWVHNVGDFVESQNNTVGAKFGRAVLMRHSEAHSTVTPFLDTDTGYIPGSFTATNGVLTTIFKDRLLDIEPGIVQTGDFTSILGDDFKLSILGALGVQRLKGL